MEEFSGRPSNACVLRVLPIVEYSNLVLERKAKTFTSEAELLSTFEGTKLRDMAFSAWVCGSRSNERDRKSELVLRSTYQIFERDRNGAGTFGHQPFGRQKILPISATEMSPKCRVNYVNILLVP